MVRDPARISWAEKGPGAEIHGKELLFQVSHVNRKKSNPESLSGSFEHETPEFSHAVPKDVVPHTDSK